MEPTEEIKKKPDLRARLVERMHDPAQLRAALCVALLAVWYSMGYMPMSDQIAKTAARLDLDRKRLALASEIEALRGEAAEFADRLPPRTDPNEFLQYILDGVRSHPIKLVSLIPERAKDAGPYQVASVRVELEGKYQDVDALLRWVENDKRLLRVDNLKVDPDSRDVETLKVSLSILGLMGIEEAAGPPSNAGISKSRPKVIAPKGKPPAPKSAKSP